MLTIGHVWEGLTAKKLEPTLAEKVKFTTVVVNSRLAQAGSLFIALRGEHEDGHNFVGDAFSRGAAAAIVARRVEPCTVQIDTKGDPKATLAQVDGQPLCIKVPDTLKALQDIAAYWRKKFEVRVIGVTGSTGKTTTKETIYSVLSRAFSTLKSPGNYNNEIGLPLTLLELDGTREKAILEMGMYALGEIRELAVIAQPQVGVVTNVGPSHLERLGSLEAIAQAKAELVEALPTDGVAILNGDDPRVREMAGKTSAQVLFYGLAEDCHFRATEIESRGLEGVRFCLHHGEESSFVKIPILGRHSVHAALSAAAAGAVEGQPWDKILEGLQDITAQLRLIAYPGVNGSTVIDDTYNSNPDSALAALNLLSEFEGRKIAVLGDMLELGSYEETGHKIVGRRAGEVVDVLITVGPRAKIIAQEAGGRPEVTALETNAQALEVLNKILTPGDIVLVKGSRALKMEEVVAQVMRR